MRKFIKVGLALSSLALFSACGGTWEESGVSNPPVATQAAAPKTAAQVQLFAEQAPTQAYTEIKEIKVAVNKTTAFHPNPTVAQVEERLKKSAAALGGDAVINVVISDVKVRAMSWGGRVGTGTVVAYQ